MTCRCSSPAVHASRAAEQSARSERSTRESKDKEIKELKDEIFGMIVKSTKYEIVEAVEVGAHLVMKVKYPNCKTCEFEGIKVIVFAGTNAINALKWKRIDPHFRKPTKNPVALMDHAPPPVARFPNNNAGWSAALEFAKRLP
jgi:hypothetical protein